MAKSLYTARAHVVGGRDQGHGVSSDGALDVQLRTPVEMGGEGGGTNPEQLFAVGYAACFEGALGVVGRRERVDLGAASIDSEVSLITTENRGFNVAVGLDVSLPGISDPERAVSIVAAAHEVCPYSNATRGNVEVNLKANGHPVPTTGPGGQLTIAASTGGDVAQRRMTATFPATGRNERGQHVQSWNSFHEGNDSEIHRGDVDWRGAGALGWWSHHVRLCLGGECLGKNDRHFPEGQTFVAHLGRGDGDAACEGHQRHGLCLLGHTDDQGPSDQEVLQQRHRG